MELLDDTAKNYNTLLKGVQIKNNPLLGNRISLTFNNVLHTLLP